MGNLWGLFLATQHQNLISEGWTAVFAHAGLKQLLLCKFVLALCAKLAPWHKLWKQRVYPRLTFNLFELHFSFSLFKYALMQQSHTNICHENIDPSDLSAFLELRPGVKLPRFWEMICCCVRNICFIRLVSVLLSAGLQLGSIFMPPSRHTR